MISLSTPTGLPIVTSGSPCSDMHKWKIGGYKWLMKKFCPAVVLIKAASFNVAQVLTSIEIHAEYLGLLRADDNI